MNSHRLSQQARVIMLIIVAALVVSSAPPALASVCTLADHIRSANTNTAVGFCPAGTSHDIITLTEDIRLTEPLPAITGTITIEGGGHTISGGNQFRIFDVDGSGKFTVSKLTLADGFADRQAGGAIRLQNDATLTVDQVSFRNNKAKWGGAIGARDGRASLVINQSSFIANTAEYGGAIALTVDNATIDRSNFRQNSATRSGGAVQAWRGAVGIVNTTFSENAAGTGGGLQVEGAEVALTHVTMVDNSARQVSGASIRRRAGLISLRNSILAGESDADHCWGHLDQNIGSLIEDWTCNPEYGGDPMLGPMEGAVHLYAPQDGSPMINAANRMFCPKRDQVGTARPQGATCDIGAIESTSAFATQAQAVDPICTLHDHIKAANSRRAVGGCPAGTSHNIITITDDITLRLPLPPITGTITIEGGGHVISGDNKFSIFEVDGGRLTINNLTLTEGRGGDGAGALNVRNHGEVVVNDSTFTNNRGSEGGAIYTYWPGPKLTINNTSFIKNRSQWGGGAIQMWGGIVAINNSSFVDNWARGTGGAIGVQEGDDISIANSTFVGNDAGQGGAIGGGHLPITLTHVTMVNNRGSVGKAMYFYEGETRVSLRNSVIAGDVYGDLCKGSLFENVGNLIKDGSCGSRVGGEALLGEMTGWLAHFPLLDFSPAVDAADERFCTPFDQVGTERPQGGGCDIGAIESIAALPAPVVVPDICPLDDQIIAANTDTAIGNCPAGDGADRITLLRDFTLLEPLPPITSEIAIDGAGYTISGARKFRLFDVDGGTLTIQNATLAKGSASIGGAIRLRNGAKVNIENVTFSANDANWGGAIATQSADVALAINSSSFIDNTSRNNAGALFVDGGAVRIAHSSFSGNSAKFMAGAIDGSAGTIEIMNSTISGNQAERGAGIYLSGAEATLTHLTVVDNRARFATGGGVFMETGSARLRNSIVYGNGAAEDCLGGLDQSVGNFSGDGSCSSGVRGNPYLGELAGAPAHHPLYGDSPAIDAADARFCPAIDQVGAKRPIGARCDSGAIEASVDGLHPTGSLMRILRPSAECSLRDLIVAVNSDAPVGGCSAGHGADIIDLTADVTLSEPLPPITSEVQLRGNGHTISGAGRYRIFDIDGGSLTVKNLRLIEGFSPGEKGGAIRLQSGELTVADATLSGNEAGWGGAIAMLGGRFTLYKSNFLDNAAENRGGAIWMEGGCEVMVDSVLRRNSATLGEREPGPMHDHFGSAIEWAGRAGGGCGDDVFASNVKVYDE
ncbi:MAG: right-handed parallel beta-helix repeat-containing protein [Chloroflexota bacterium]|nr:right-handed parallel beta-helix repeat-containing protein [Chloroflexota bacterium]